VYIAAIGIPKTMITATRPTKFPSIVDSFRGARLARGRLEAAVNMKYGGSAEKFR
jgi:hypothetical protein